MSILGANKIFFSIFSYFPIISIQNEEFIFVCLSQKEGWVAYLN